MANITKKKKPKCPLWWQTKIIIKNKILGIQIYKL